MRSTAVGKNQQLIGGWARDGGKCIHTNWETEIDNVGLNWMLGKKLSFQKKIIKTKPSFLPQVLYILFHTMIKIWSCVWNSELSKDYTYFFLNVNGVITYRVFLNRTFNIRKKQPGLS